MHTKEDSAAGVDLESGGFVIYWASAVPTAFGKRRLLTAEVSLLLVGFAGPPS